MNSHLLPTVCRFRGKLLKSSAVSISSYEQYLAEKEERYKSLELNVNFNSKWEFTHRQSHSAMNSGIQVLKQELGADKVIHLGLPGDLETVEGQKISWSELNENSEMRESLINELYSELKQIPLLIEPEIIHSYYNGYCKSGKIYIYINIEKIFYFIFLNLVINKCYYIHLFFLFKRMLLLSLLFRYNFF